MQSKPVKQSYLRGQWWKNCSGITRFYPKRDGKTLKDISEKLDEVKDWGFDAIEVFAPYHGGREYAGLDAVDYFAVDPAIGTMEDFKALIKCCHDKGIAVIAFINLGYCAMECPAFLKACNDIKSGIDSPETHWFLWSETGIEQMDRSLAPHFMNDTDGHWHYSEKAGKYYWVKWKGINGDVELPQFNFGDPVWREECKKIVKFWMDTGIDGMIIDAVNWYINCNWQINNETMTDIIRQYPNKYIQPEGAGGFKDDPVMWITEGKYNSVQDYGISIWWNDHDVIGEAIESGDPSGIEAALRAYRDRVVAVGGVTYIGPYWAKKVSYEQRLLEVATIATIGEIFHDNGKMMDLDWPVEQKSRLKAIIKILQAYPALQAAGSREKLDTNDDHKYYAFIRTSKDGKQQVLVVLNFQKVQQEIHVDLKNLVNLTDVFTRDEVKNVRYFKTVLPAYGYGIYEMIPS